MNLPLNLKCCLRHGMPQNRRSARIGKTSKITYHAERRLGKSLFEIETELAKRRHEKQHGENGRYQPLSSNEPSGRAKDIVAKKIGV